MAYPRLGHITAAVAVLGGCAAPAVVATAPIKPQASAFEGVPMRVRSDRLRLSLELPDGGAWVFDPTTQPNSFTVRHAASHSVLTILFFDDAELVNRAKCRTKTEERALVRGGPYDWVAREVVVAPQVYDTFLTVGVLHGSRGLRGTLLATGAFLRKCMVFQFDTETALGEPETVLATKLAQARSMMFETLTLDPMRTGVDAEVPVETRKP